MTTSGPQVLLNDHGKLIDRPAGPSEAGLMALVDLANRSVAELVVGDMVYRNAGRGKFEPARSTGLLKGAAMAEGDF